MATGAWLARRVAHRLRVGGVMRDGCSSEAAPSRAVPARRHRTITARAPVQPAQRAAADLAAVFTVWRAK